MKDKHWLTQKELLQKTGIKFYKLDYLVKTGDIPVIQKGSGNLRQFPDEAVRIIKVRLARRGKRSNVSK